MARPLFQSDRDRIVQLAEERVPFKVIAEHVGFADVTCRRAVMRANPQLYKQLIKENEHQQMRKFKSFSNWNPKKANVPPKPKPVFTGPPIYQSDFIRNESLFAKARGAR